MMRGKVVLVPFPFDDLSSTKVRPAVCLTDSIGPHCHVVLGFISSQIPTEILDTDVIIPTDQYGFHLTGLRVSSVLRLHRLMTLTTALIKRELGELAPEMQSEVDRRLKKLFSL